MGCIEVQVNMGVLGSRPAGACRSLTRKALRTVIAPDLLRAQRSESLLETIWRRLGGRVGFARDQCPRCSRCSALWCFAARRRNERELVKRYGHSCHFRNQSSASRQVRSGSCQAGTRHERLRGEVSKTLMVSPRTLRGVRVEERRNS